MARKQTLYVGIDDPVSVRKDLLMSSKQLLQGLKSYSQLKDVRHRKLEHMYEYRRLLEEIFVLMKKLQKVMPNAPKPEKQVVKPVQKKRVKQSLVPADDMTSVRELEGQLDDIESKLKKLKT